MHVLQENHFLNITASTFCIIVAQKRRRDSTFDIRHSTFDIRHSTFDIRHSTFDTYDAATTCHKSFNFCHFLSFESATSAMQWPQMFLFLYFFNILYIFRAWFLFKNESAWNYLSNDPIPIHSSRLWKIRLWERPPFEFAVKKNSVGFIGLFCVLTLYTHPSHLNSFQVAINFVQFLVVWSAQRLVYNCRLLEKYSSEPICVGSPVLNVQKTSNNKCRK